MDIKNLITFIQAAELGSFTRAGQNLGFSQSTVSFQIKQLERELDAQLFERINHTVALTDRGREVLRYAHQITKLSEELAKELHSEHPVAGDVRLAMADSLCDSLLRQDFNRFREQYPGISLKIIAAGTGEMFRLLDRNEVDLVLTLDSHVYQAEYVIVREEQVGVHFVAPAGHPLCREERAPLSRLIEQPFLLTEKGMSYRRILEEWLAERSLEIRPVLEIGSAGLIASLVEQGAGLSFLPDYVTEEGIRGGRLSYIKTELFETGVWKQLLYHRDKWVTPQMEAVLREVERQEFGR